MKSHFGLIPILRFPEFDGEWEEITLGDAVKFENGKAHENEIVENGRFIVVNSKFISSGGRIKKYSDRQISPLFKDDVVMVMSDVPKGQALARCFYIDQDNLYTLNQRICALRANGYDTRFLFYLVDRNRYFLAFDSGVGQTNLRKDEVLDCPLIVPESTDEQYKVGAFLSAVDQKISQFVRKKELLLKYKKGVMQQIFDQKIRFKDDSGNGFPNWASTRLSDVCQINPRSGELPDTFVYIDLESVESGSLNKETLLRRDEAPSRAQRLLEKGDILFQMVRPYQSNNLVFDRDGSFVASTGYAQIRSRIDTRFLFQLLLTYSFVNNVVRRCTGTSYPAINSEDLAEIKIDIPVRREQEKIGEFLAQIDAKMDLLAQQIQRTKAFKRGLLHQMFVS